MEAAKEAVSKFLHRSGEEQTQVNERFVTLELENTPLTKQQRQPSHYERDGQATRP